MKRPAYLLLLFALPVLAGCVTTSVTPLSPKKYPATPPGQVVIYLDEAEIPGRFERIALIHAEGDYALTDEAQMYRKVRAAAAKVGANAVLIREVREPSTGAKVANAILGTGANRRGEVVAIFVFVP